MLGIQETNNEQPSDVQTKKCKAEQCDKDNLGPEIISR